MTFINQGIILSKSFLIVKLVIDPSYLNSITDLSRYSWPLDQIANSFFLTRLNGNYITTSDVCFAYNQVPLMEVTQKLEIFVIRGKQYTIQRGLCGLCGSPNFISRIMTIHLASLKKSRQSATYIGGTILQDQTAEEKY